MDVQKDKSLIMAERLKELRVAEGISHEALSEKLKKKYDIKISSDSLMNYEVTDPYHTKAGKNQGMRVEYLRCLADFYNVSADYLLGTTDVRSPDISAQGIVEKTGLSPCTVEWLIKENPHLDYTKQSPIYQKSIRHAFVYYLLEAAINCTENDRTMLDFRHTYRALKNNSSIPMNEDSLNSFLSIFSQMEQYGMYSISCDDAANWFAQQIANTIGDTLLDTIERFGC